MDEGNGRNGTLDELERDAERDRAQLAGTVEALRGRLGGGGGGLSGTLSAGARDYAAGRRADATQGILRRVEEHPLQTVALAAGIAYPLVRIVTKIPAPILMLGAGVALAGRGGSDRTQEHVEIVVEPASDAEAVGAPGTEFRRPEIAATGGMSSRPPARTDPGPGPGPANVAADPVAATSEAVSRAGARAARAGRAGGETLLQSIRRNPVAAGGASLLIGAALAAMLPRTRVEGRAFGETAEDVRKHARSLAAEGIEAGRRAVGAVASEAENQNLTGASARGVIRDGADRVSGTIRDAADDVEAAIEDAGEDGTKGAPEAKSD